MSYTEFINCRDVLFGHPYLHQRLSYFEYERPVAFQIFDDDPERMVTAALRLRELNPDIIDVNLGCSARTVTNRGAGAALLREPQKIARIIARLTHALDIPVTAKIRLGWDEDTLNYLEVARAIEANGASLLAVHGRTKMQGYTGLADWAAIAAIKHSVQIPVIANGDVRTLDDIARIKQETGCDAVMIGRAALTNPWLFARLEREAVPASTVLATMRVHLVDMVDYYGPERAVLLFRKYAKRLLTPLDLDRQQMTALLTDEDYQSVMRRLQIIFDGLSA